MDPIQRIQNLEQIKTLSDSRRLAILQMLMSGPETLTSIGKALGEHPARVRHHLKLLEAIGLIELVETRTQHGFVEKYYQAKAKAFIFNELILPQHPMNPQETIVATGSHDLALELLARRLAGEGQKERILTIPVGSLEGLIALRQGNAHLAGSHLIDGVSDEYNLSYVRHLFPDRLVTLFTLAYREQGLMVSPGNPKGIRGLQDLVREDVTLINRNRGSGTRVWLDQQMDKLGIDLRYLRGYEQEVRTHTQVAAAIQAGRADVGLGLQAAAQQYQLDFMPLFQERYDLVIPLEMLDNRLLVRLLDYLQSGAFRREANALGGYDTTHSGDQIDPNEKG